MVSLFLLLGCNWSYIVDLFAALHELASTSSRTLQKLASSVHARAQSTHAITKMYASANELKSEREEKKR